MRSIQFGSSIHYHPKREGFDIETSKELSNKGIINIKTGTSGNCFILSVLACLYRDKIHLPEVPDSAYLELNYSQRTKLERRWQLPDSNKLILQDVIKKNGWFVKEFLGTVSFHEIS